MREFPSPLEILGDLVERKPHTPLGQRATAEYIVALVQKWALGNARIVEYPEGAQRGHTDPSPCNVVIDVGSGTEEQVVVYAHRDTVPPDDYPKDFERNPDVVTQDPNDPDLVKAVGVYDDLGSIAGILTALHGIKVEAHRKIRVIIVDGEEDQSWGTFAAMDPSNDLFKNASCLVSNDIPGGAQLGDSPGLLIGRAGRVGLRLQVHGPSTHIGAVKRANYDTLAATRDAKARLALGSVNLSGHPLDRLQLMAESLCIVGSGFSEKRSGVTVPGEWVTHVNVIYSDPYLTKERIMEIVGAAIRNAIGDHFTLTPEEGRVMPFTGPWLEDADHPFVQNGLQIAREVTGIDVPLRAGHVGDESIIATAKGIPALSFYVDGTGEHTNKEAVRISSIKNHLVPFLQRIASFPALLTRRAV